MKLKKYQPILCVIAAAAFLGTAAFCGWHIYDHYAQMDEQAELFGELSQFVENAPVKEETPEDTPVSEGEDILAQYEELYL